MPNVSEELDGIIKKGLSASRSFYMGRQNRSGLQLLTDKLYDAEILFLVNPSNNTLLQVYDACENLHRATDECSPQVAVDDTPGLVKQVASYYIKRFEGKGACDLRIGWGDFAAFFNRIPAEERLAYLARLKAASKDERFSLDDVRRTYVGLQSGGDWERLMRDPLTEQDLQVILGEALVRVSFLLKKD